MKIEFTTTITKRTIYKPLIPKRKIKVFRFYTEQELNTIIKLHNQGVSAKEIGKQVGRTALAISNKIHLLYHDFDLINSLNKK